MKRMFGYILVTVHGFKGSKVQSSGLRVEIQNLVSSKALLKEEKLKNVYEF